MYINESNTNSPLLPTVLHRRFHGYFGLRTILAGLLLVLFEPTDHVLDFLKGQCLLGGDAALEHHLAVVILFLFETQLANRVLPFVYLLQSHLLVDVLDT